MAGPVHVDPMDLAQQAVTVHVPEARVALLAGSTASGLAGATSDLDVVAVVGGPSRSWRKTVVHRDRIVEMFVYTEDTVDEWWRRDASRGQCTLAHMCATGVLVLDDGLGHRLAERAAAFIAAGPPPVSQEQVDGRRYLLTAALDDLTDATDPDERDLIAAGVLEAVGELALIARRQWLGEGRWLVRRLRAADPQLTDALFDAHRAVARRGDVAALVSVATHVLMSVGGPLSDGYSQGG